MSLRASISSASSKSTCSSVEEYSSESYESIETLVPFLSLFVSRGAIYEANGGYNDGEARLDDDDDGENGSMYSSSSSWSESYLDE